MKRKNTYRTSLGILIIGVLVIAGALAVLFRSPAETPAKDATSSVISEGSVAQTDPAHGSDSGRNEASSETPESIHVLHCWIAVLKIQSPTIFIWPVA